MTWFAPGLVHRERALADLRLWACMVALTLLELETFVTSNLLTNEHVHCSCLPYSDASCREADDAGFGLSTPPPHAVRRSRRRAAMLQGPCPG